LLKSPTITSRFNHLPPAFTRHVLRGSPESMATSIRRRWGGCSWPVRQFMMRMRTRTCARKRSKKEKAPN